jgi:hypothetical protein
MLALDVLESASYTANRCMDATVMIPATQVPNGDPCELSQTLVIQLQRWCVQ